jgi:HlyD family secretion protein
MDRPIQRTWTQRHGRKTAAAVAALAVAIGLTWFAPAEGTRSLAIRGDNVVIAAVTTGQFDDFIPVRGRVTPLRTIYLDAVDGGRVEKVLVEDGAMVQEGDVLVELSNTSLQLDVLSREAQVTEQLNVLRTLELDLERNRLQHERDLVEIDYQLTRLERLVERRRAQAARGNVPRADLEDAEDELDYYRNRRRLTVQSRESDLRLQEAQLRQLRETAGQLEANLGVARGNLTRLQVRAPMTGKLTALNAEVGQSLAPGDRIGQVDDPDRFKLSALVDEFYLGRVDLGQRAEWSDGNRRHALAVSKIYPQVNNREFEVELAFDGEPPAAIRRGQTLQLQLFLGNPTEAMLLPNGAFYQDTGGDWVFVVSSDGRQALRRTVRLGRRNMRFVEVLDGLQPGEQVVISSYGNYLDMQRLDFKS